jgi:hypothetical protein
MPALVDTIVPRRLAGVVADLLAEEPVIVLQGPRSVGKSTLMRGLATARDRESVTKAYPAGSAASSTVRR